MLTAVVVVPALAAAALVVDRRWTEPVARWFSLVAAAVPLALLTATWARFDTGAPGPFQLVEDAEWIPTLGVGWRLGVDGISLALALLTSLLFVAALAYPVDLQGRHRQYRAWFLFLEAVSLGLFLTLDLLLFYVFFDLSLVGMYFLIGRWGHGDAKAAAPKFFPYTLAGSLVMLLGFLALYLPTDTLTFDLPPHVFHRESNKGGSGHYYMLTDGVMTWAEAEAQAVVCRREVVGRTARDG